MPCKVFSPRPDPSPVGPSEIGSDDDQNPLPCHKERIEENGQIAAAMEPIAFSMRIAVEIRDGHQSNDNAHRNRDASPKGIIGHHFLQTQEVPRGFRRICRLAWICRLFQRSIDKGESQNKHRRQQKSHKLCPQQMRPGENKIIRAFIDSRTGSSHKLHQPISAFDTRSKRFFGVGALHDAIGIGTNLIGRPRKAAIFADAPKVDSDQSACQQRQERPHAAHKSGSEHLVPHWSRLAA